MDLKSWVSLPNVTSTLIFTLFYLPIVLLVSHYGFWRHDDIPYLDTFAIKLGQEGRWVNYYLFRLLQTIPNYLSWVLSFSFYFYFFYFVASRTFASKIFGFLVACICLASPSFFAQMNWPSTTLPATFSLVLCTYFFQKLPFYIFLPIASILYFGLFPQFIYFFPLLYLSNSFKNIREASIWWLRFMFAWGASFILGYLIANVITWSILGHTIQLHSWRKPKPATDLASLVDNLGGNAWRLVNHSIEFFPYWPAVFLAFMFFVIFALRRPKRLENWNSALFTIIVGVAIAGCHYIITAPSGIIIQYRTVSTLYIGIVFIFLALGFLTSRRAVITAALVTIALPAWYDSYRNVNWYSRVSSEMRASVHQVLSRPATEYNGVIVDAKCFSEYYAHITTTLPDKPGPVFEELDKPFRWQRALNEEGFSNIYLCPSGIGIDALEFHQKCSTLDDTTSDAGCRDKQVLISPVGITSNDELMLRFQP